MSSDDQGRRSNEPGTTSVIAGASIVAAAAGYALLAFRFKNLQAGKPFTGPGSAELRAAESVTATAERLAAAERAFRRLEEQARRQQQARDWHLERSDLRWAMELLNLERAPSTLGPVKAAYHAEAKKCHPDLHNDHAATEKFKRLSVAYQAVSAHVEQQA